MKENINNLLNDQLNKELYSSYLYLDFVRFFETLNLRGFAHWYKLQAREEIDHAMKIFEYIIANNGNVILKSISAINNDYFDISHVLKAALTHEQYITKSIENIYKIAEKEEDIRTQRFLDWFIYEQAEEEENAINNIANFELCVSDNKNTLYFLDKDMHNR